MCIPCWNWIIILIVFCLNLEKHTILVLAYHYNSEKGIILPASSKSSSWLILLLRTSTERVALARKAEDKSGKSPCLKHILVGERSLSLGLSRHSVTLHYDVNEMPSGL